MTQTQSKIYRFVISYHAKHGVVPPSAVTGKRFTVSRQYVESVYNELIKQGKLRKKPVVSRYELCG